MNLSTLYLIVLINKDGALTSLVLIVLQFNHYLFGKLVPPDLANLCTFPLV